MGPTASVYGDHSLVVWKNFHDFENRKTTFIIEKKLS